MAAVITEGGITVDVAVTRGCTRILGTLDWPWIWASMTSGRSAAEVCTCNYTYKIGVKLSQTYQTDILWKKLLFSQWPIRSFFEVYNISKLICIYAHTMSLFQCVWLSINVFVRNKHLLSANKWLWALRLLWGNAGTVLLQMYWGILRREMWK